MPNLTTAALFVASIAGAAALAGQGFGPKPVLPEPNPSHAAAKVATAVGWLPGKMPGASKDFIVGSFADGLQHPRWLYVLPSGDVLVAEASTVMPAPKTAEDKQKHELLTRSGALAPNANRITLLRDANGDGVADISSPFLEGLNQPFGMALVGQTILVANTDGVWCVSATQPARRRSRRAAAEFSGCRRAADHWARNLIVNEAGTKMYIGVGSASNIAEQGLRAEERPRRHSRGQHRRHRRAHLRVWLAQSARHGLGAGTSAPVDRGERTRRAGRGPGARLSHPRDRRRLLWLAVQLFRREPAIRA